MADASRSVRAPLDVHGLWSAGKIADRVLENLSELDMVGQFGLALSLDDDHGHYG